MADAELSAAITPLSAESERRKRERSRHEKAGLSKRNEREPRCPECKVRLMRDGKRHDGAGSHNGIVKGLSLSDDWVKFVAGDEECERKMKLMSNCCPYLRHCFESHKGIKFSKLEAYGSFFLCRWCQVRKHGLKATIDILFNRVCGTPKSGLSAKLFRKASIGRETGVHHLLV